MASEFGLNEVESTHKSGANVIKRKVAITK